MSEQTNSVIIEFLDIESKFHYLNYFYSKRLDETSDEEYVCKLECLYEWWAQEEPTLNYNPDSDSDSYYTESQWLNERSKSKQNLS